MSSRKQTGFPPASMFISEWSIFLDSNYEYEFKLNNKNKILLKSVNWTTGNEKYANNFPVFGLFFLAPPPKVLVNVMIKCCTFMHTHLKRSHDPYCCPPTASIEDRDQLVKYFQRLGRDTLYAICEYLHLVPPKGSQDDTETEYNQVGCSSRKCTLFLWDLERTGKKDKQKY